RLAPLVDDQLYVRGALPMRAHPLTPARDRRGELGVVELRERGPVPWRVDDHLVEAGRRKGTEEIRLASARDRPQGIAGRGHSASAASPSASAQLWASAG